MQQVKTKAPLEEQAIKSKTPVAAVTSSKSDVTSASRPSVREAAAVNSQPEGEIAHDVPKKPTILQITPAANKVMILSTEPVEAAT